MAKFFDLEIREAYEKPYLKVFIKDIDRIGEVQVFLERLNSVARVNITRSYSRYSPPQNLTVYPSRVYDVAEVRDEVQVSLESYFAGSPVDPQFIDEAISSISDNAYFQILDYILRLGMNLEKYKDLTSNFDEERCRDYFLPFLNSISKGHSATGETFNKIGRTDILVQDSEGSNIFIAECKIWRGSAKLRKAIDQLLERYVNWRDEKVALIIFNKDVQNFSEVVQTATAEVEKHPNCIKLLEKRCDTSFSFSFRHPDNDARTIKSELILFNFA